MAVPTGGSRATRKYTSVTIAAPTTGPEGSTCDRDARDLAQQRWMLQGAGRSIDSRLRFRAEHLTMDTWRGTWWTTARSGVGVTRPGG